jgi:hypothetical protein
MRLWPALLPIALLPILLFALAQAHVPVISEGQEELSTATPISDVEKSWAIYSFLDGRSEYYSLYAEKDQRIYLSLLASTNPREEGFQPSMALLGPALGEKGDLPKEVEVPPGYGHVAVEGHRVETATYEPFGPSSYFHLAEIDLLAPEAGRYYVAVYGNQSGHYSLAVGFLEEFGFAERIAAPIMLLYVYRWEGQSPITILMPWVAAALVGAMLVLNGPKRTPFYCAGTMAALLFIGTSASVLAQTVYNLTRAPYGSEVAISLALALIPAVLGVIALRLSRGEAGILQRSILAAVGTLGLLAGSGLIIGPVLAVVASVLPPGKRNQ